MKKAFITGIAALFLATGAAHAGSPLIEESYLIGAWHCEVPTTDTRYGGGPIPIDIELRKYAVHDNAFLIRGMIPVWGNDQSLTLKLTDDMEVIFFNGVPCQAIKDGN